MVNFSQIVRYFVGTVVPLLGVVFAVLFATLAVSADLIGVSEWLSKNGWARPNPATYWVAAIVLTGLLIFWFAWQLIRVRSAFSLLRSSLPILFAKTAHLRQQVSANRLNFYRDLVRNPITKAGDGIGQVAYQEYCRKLARHDKSVYLDLPDHRGFISESSHALLKDLREAIEHLTKHRDFTISMQFQAANTALSGNGQIPLTPFYDTEPQGPVRTQTQQEETRGQQELKYLLSGATLGAHCLTYPRRNSQVEHYMFNSLEEAAGYHTPAKWPEMGSHIQSLILTAIRFGDELVAVLQVDCPRKGAFTDEIGHMVECTAHGLGALFAVITFIRERCLETLGLEKKLQELEEQLREWTEKSELSETQSSEDLRQANRKIEVAKKQLDKYKEQITALEAEVAELKKGKPPA